MKTRSIIIGVLCTNFMCSRISTPLSTTRIGGSLWHDFSVSLIQWSGMMVLKFCFYLPVLKVLKRVWQRSWLHFHRPNPCLFQWVESPISPPFIIEIEPITGETMISLVVSTSPNEKIRGAALLMFTRCISKLPVVHKKKPLGIISRSDIVRLMAEF